MSVKTMLALAPFAALALSGCVGGRQCAGAAAKEAELRERLPAVFAKAEANYSALLKNFANEKSDSSPKRFQNGKIVPISPRDWCSGFFPGSLWYLYEYTGKDSWKKAAAAYTERIVEPLRHYTGDHDIGFRTYCSGGNALRLTGEKRYADWLHDTAAALRTRFDDRLGLICSWTTPRDKNGFFAPQYVVIIDNMMNLELLEWDAKNGGPEKSDRVARSQADKTDLHHFRADGSAYHILSYNRDIPDRICGIYSGQGANVEGTWARGQAWAIYGFAMMYRETRDERYLVRAEKAADYWMNEKNLPADKIPYWDFSAVGDARDASAAAITASALLELSTLTKCPCAAAKYRAFAVDTLASLASPEYFAPADEQGGFLLRHSTGCFPYRSEVDVPLNYADYYFLEALVRLNKLK